MNIREDCMLLSLTMGVWLGYKLDKEASRKTTDEANAEADAARVNKHLVPKAALANVVTTFGRVRTHFYANTLPWKDSGDRLLPRKAFTAFIEKHEELVHNTKVAVEDFLLNDYPATMARAEFRMGDMFKADDYPTASQLAHRFYVNLDIDGVPQAYDVRLETNDAAIQARISKAMKELWVRLAEPLEHLAERIAGDETLRTSSVTNLREIVNLIPALNFMEDPDLEAVRADIERVITPWEAADLRKQPEARAQVSEEAQRIIESMRGFMRSMGGGDDN
jgi:hypothetical protein